MSEEKQQNLEEFLSKEKSYKIKQVAIGLLLGWLGGLRFYQKKYISGFVILTSSFSAEVIDVFFFDSLLNIFSVMISLVVFFVVLYDLYKVFDDSEKRKLEKLKEIKNEIQH